MIGYSIKPLTQNIHCHTMNKLSKNLIDCSDVLRRLHTGIYQLLAKMDSQLIDIPGFESLLNNNTKSGGRAGATSYTNSIDPTRMYVT